MALKFGDRRYKAKHISTTVLRNGYIQILIVLGSNAKLN